jgi:cell division protein FtsW
VLGLLPNKGIPLPFISYGGSSLLSTMILMGMLLSVSEHLG